MRKASLLVLGAIALVLAPQASAHAEITPEKVPAGSVSKFVLSVEGEEDSATVKVAVQLPAGMANVKPAPVRGWQANLGGRVITFTGGRIAQGEHGKFEIAAQFPNSPGKRLKFPTVQTYANGTVVRWIGAKSSDTPAPTILLTAAATRPPPPPPPVTTTTTTTTTNAPSQNEDDDGNSTGWIVGAVVIVVLVGAAVALLWRRRRP
jgi:periplasmic copper chaperone A